MAASTITLKFSPSEYETVKAELAEQLKNLQTTLRRSAVEPRERHEAGVRAGKLEKILREI
jgi:hypothetical protein